MRKALMFLIMIVIACIPAFAADEEEWFPDAGLQPYSLEQNEDALLKGEKASSPLIEKFPNGLIIDWKKGLVIARGREFITGKPTEQNKELIRKGAAYNAKIKMVKLMDELRIDRNSRMADLLEKSFKLRAGIKQVIMAKATVIHEKHWRDQKALESTVALEIYGKGGLAEALYWPLFYWENGWDKYYKAKYEPTTDEAYTGVVVDARGLNIEPALIPRLVNEEEDILTRDRYVKPDIAINKGVVFYSDDIDRAISSPRVGPRPLVIKAVTNVKSIYNTDPIISKEDEEKLLAADKQGKFLRYMRISIVL